MGYFGGAFDLIFQRFIEIWSNVPFLYMVIIVFSIIPIESSIAARVIILLVVMVLFSWTSMTYYMRTETYKEKVPRLCHGRQSAGRWAMRIIFKHILPNVLATLRHLYAVYHCVCHRRGDCARLLGFWIARPNAQSGRAPKTRNGKSSHCALDRDLSLYHASLAPYYRDLHRRSDSRIFDPKIHALSVITMLKNTHAYLLLIFATLLLASCGGSDAPTEESEFAPYDNRAEVAQYYVPP